jgi:methionyl aminopeptidase
MKNFNDIPIKSKREIEIMQEGGKMLSEVKHNLMSLVKEGVSALDVDKEAEKQILKMGGKPSFKMVPGYNWTTCININDGVVHGIPKKEIVFKNGDVVSVDVGMYYKGFHTDTSFSLLLGKDPEKEEFLTVGKKALELAINNVRVGKRIFHISEAIESTLNKAGLRPVRSLFGHGVGRELHEEPQIPGFVYAAAQDTPEIKLGMVLAIEVIYVAGKEQLVLEKDGWTISTQDGKISALFEETVAVTPQGPLVIT